MLFRAKRIHIVLFYLILARERPPGQRVGLDKFVVVHGIIERRAQAALDIAQRLVGYLKRVEPVAHCLALQVDQQGRAERGHQSLLDDLPVSLEGATGDVLLFAGQPLAEEPGDCLPAGLRCEFRRPGRARKGHGIVEGAVGNCMLNGGLVLLCTPQVSGGGLERDPLPAPDAAIHEGDFDTAIRDTPDSPPISTHCSYPSTSTRVRPSGALIQTSPSFQMPSRIFERMASSV